MRKERPLKLGICLDGNGNHQDHDLPTLLHRVLAGAAAAATGEVGAGGEYNSFAVSPAVQAAFRGFAAASLRTSTTQGYL